MLVDTGYGLSDVDHPHRGPRPRITRAMRTLLNIQLRESETAIPQIEALGFGGAVVVGGRQKYRGKAALFVGRVRRL